jgi:hypothetical protein
MLKRLSTLAVRPDSAGSAGLSGEVPEAGCLRFQVRKARP